MTQGEQHAPAGVLDGWLQYVLDEGDTPVLVETAHLLADIHLGLPEQTAAAWSRVLVNGGLIYEVLVAAMRRLTEEDREHESFALSQRWKVPLVARPYIDRLREVVHGREELELSGFYAAFDTLSEGVRQLGAARNQEEMGRAIQWTHEARQSLCEALDRRAVHDPIQALRLGRIVPADELIDALHERGGAVALVDFTVAPEGTFVHIVGRSGREVEVRAILLTAFTIDRAFEVGSIYDSYVVRKADPARIDQALEDVTALLHHRLWCPLAQELGQQGFSQIILVPDAWTRPLPHHLSKVCGKEIQVPPDVPVVSRERIIDLFPLEVAPSVQTVAISQWQLRPQVVDNVLMVADPENDLPGAAWTARWLGPRLAAEITYTSLVGADAARDSFLKEASKARVIIFGGHGDYVPDNPFRSYLRLSGGTLTLADVLDREVVTPGAVYVLSACELGTGFPGETVQGYAFPGALLAGGAACVVAALWEMEDVSFGYLTERFLYYLAYPGYRPAAALFRAMNATKEWTRDAVSTHLEEMLDWMEATDRAEAHPEHYLRLVDQLAWVEDEAGEFPFRDPKYWGGAVVFGAGWATQSGAHIHDPDHLMKPVEVLLERKGEKVRELIDQGQFKTASEQLDEWFAWAHGPERIEPATLEADLARAAGVEPAIVASLYGRLALLGGAHGNEAVRDYALRNIRQLRGR